jgi:hypothetical protein
MRKRGEALNALWRRSLLVFVTSSQTKLLIAPLWRNKHWIFFSFLNALYKMTPEAV